MSWVSAHGCLNIPSDFGPNGRLPGIKTPYVCIEAATMTPWNGVQYMGAYPGVGACPEHYSIIIIVLTLRCWFHWTAGTSAIRSRPAEPGEPGGWWEIASKTHHNLNQKNNNQHLQCSSKSHTSMYRPPLKYMTLYIYLSIYKDFWNKDTSLIRTLRMVPAT